MPITKVEAPDGSIIKVEHPKGASESEIITYAQANFKPAPADSGGPLAETAGDALAGAVRGAGSIGATLLAPVDIASDLFAGKGLTLESNRERRWAMDAALQGMGANPGSGAYQAGKIGTEIAGTLPVGGLLGKLIGKVAPTLGAAVGSGGFALGRPAATGLIGRAGDAATRAAGGAITGGAQMGLIDPSQAEEGAVVGGLLPGAVKVAGAAGKAIGRGLGTVGANVLGAATGTSAETVGAALQAGKTGASEFLENMRGETGFDDVVTMAKQAVANLRGSRQQEYRSGMVDIANDKTVLDFAPIDSAMQKISGMGKYKGVQINAKSADTVKELDDVVSQWKSLDPSEYHTPEGLDALKKAVGDIRDSTQFGSPARKAADELYHAVKGEITKQAPTYSKVMGDYSRASDLITEIEKSLSLGNKAAADTAVRKLQSLMRNNAQTSYGNRLGLAKTLEDKGGVSLIPSIAGQAMNSWMPRGMVGAIEKTTLPLAAVLSSPSVMAAAPFTSPRLMGEALYSAGRIGGLLGEGASTVSPQLQRAISPQTLKALARTGLLYGPTLAATQKAQQ
jgi:hypothetical protein